jgi:hypothetical protein
MTYTIYNTSTTAATTTGTYYINNPITWNSGSTIMTSVPIQQTSTPMPKAETALDWLNDKIEQVTQLVELAA